MKKLKKIEGCCAVVALLYVSGLLEDTVLRVCKLHGFENGEGMEDSEWQAAAEELGIKFRAIPMEPMRLRKFVKQHSKGLFLAGTHNHLFVVDNGKVVDPNETPPPGWGRVIKQAWRVS